MKKQKTGASEAKWKKRNWLAMAFFLSALLLQVLARRVSGFAQGYAATVYRMLVETVGRILSVFPFSVVEIGLYALIGAAVIGAVWLIRKVICGQVGWRKAVMQTAEVLFLAVSVLFFSYTVGCGINYHRTAFSVEAGFQIEKSSKEELMDLCRFLVLQINEAAEEIQTDENGCMKLSGDVKETARQAMAALGEEYESLAGYYPVPKGIGISRILSVQKIEGIYSPFTLEANYNREMPDENIPVAICHELSHLRGYMREDEANFIAYLACMASEDPQFVYSASILAFVHSGNALYGDGGQEEYWELYDMLCDTAKADLSADRVFWKQFDGKVAEVSNKVNDTYLKVNKQEDGVKSYGRMVDLLLAMYREGRQ